MASIDTEIRAVSYVGFDSITSQIEHKLLKRGFQFNVIVVGELFLFFWASWVVLSCPFLHRVPQDERVLENPRW
jgi:hypothetical protein